MLSLANTLHPYTTDPDEGPNAIFSNHADQILSNCIHLLGASILACCIGRRSVYYAQLSRERHGLPWSKICVMLIFLVSWLFIIAGGVLVSGIGLSLNLRSCSAGIYLCIALYTVSKILIYAFLVERVHVVWRSRSSLQRRDSWVYRICLTIVLLYIVVIVVMFIGQVSFLRADGQCVVGLKLMAGIPLLGYDFFINILLTVLFIWPLFAGLKNRRLHVVALKTLCASGAALTTSSVNIALLVLLRGELGWVCLGSCATDVTLNALVLYWVTSSPNRRTHDIDDDIPDLHFNASSSPSSERLPTVGNFRLKSLNGGPSVCTCGHSAAARADAASVHTMNKRKSTFMTGHSNPSSPVLAAFPKPPPQPLLLKEINEAYSTIDREPARAMSPHTASSRVRSFGRTSEYAEPLMVHVSVVRDEFRDDELAPPPTSSSAPASSSSPLDSAKEPSAPPHLPRRKGSKK